LLLLGGGRGRCWCRRRRRRRRRSGCGDDDNEGFAAARGPASGRDCAAAIAAGERGRGDCCAHREVLGRWLLALGEREAERIKKSEETSFRPFSFFFFLQSFLRGRAEFPSPSLFTFFSSTHSLSAPESKRERGGQRRFSFSLFYEPERLLPSLSCPLAPANGAVRSRGDRTGQQKQTFFFPLFLFSRWTSPGSNRPARGCTRRRFVFSFCLGELGETSSYVTGRLELQKDEGQNEWRERATISLSFGWCIERQPRCRLAVNESSFAVFALPFSLFLFFLLSAPLLSIANGRHARPLNILKQKITGCGPAGLGGEGARALPRRRREHRPVQGKGRHGFVAAPSSLPCGSFLRLSMRSVRDRSARACSRD